jgi:hypothetical protein
MLNNKVLLDTSNPETQSSSSKISPEEDKVYTTPPGTFNVLGCVPNKKLEQFRLKLLQLREKRSMLPKDSSSVNCIKLVAAQRRLYLPESFFEEDNVWAMFFADICLRLNIDVIKFVSDQYVPRVHPDVHDKLVLGLAFSISDTANFKFKVKQDLIEYGRTIGMGIRVRGYFRDHPRLGIESLRKNQLFFGNNPVYNQKTKLLKEDILLKTELSTYYSTSVTMELCSVITSLLESRGLMDIPENLVNSIISDNLITYEDIADTFRRKPKGETITRKHFKRKDEGKLPEKASSSPLILQEEMSIIDSLISPFWQSLIPIQKEWVKFILKHGFKKIRDLVKATFIARWQITINFANVTTKRLREIKKLNSQVALTRKRSIKKDDLRGMLTHRTNALSTLLSELRSIISSVRIVDMQKGVGKINVLNPKDIAQRFRELPSPPYNMEGIEQFISGTGGTWEGITRTTIETGKFVFSMRNLHPDSKIEIKNSFKFDDEIEIKTKTEKQKAIQKKTKQTRTFLIQKYQDGSSQKIYFEELLDLLLADEKFARTVLKEPLSLNSETVLDNELFIDTGTVFNYLNHISEIAGVTKMIDSKDPKCVVWTPMINSTKE